MCELFLNDLSIVFDKNEFNMLLSLFKILCFCYFFPIVNAKCFTIKRV